MIETNIKDILKQWIEDFLMNKDLIQKKIIGIERSSDFDSLIRYKDKEVHISVQPFMKEIDAVISKMKPESEAIVVVLNTEENLKILIEKWQSLKKFPKLSFYFVNPNSSMEKKWIINPYIHSRWCDESTLKMGLRSMFETVTPFDKL